MGSYVYIVRWLTRNNVEEFRVIKDINQANKLKNYLLKNNVQNVDLAVRVNDTTSMFPGIKKPEQTKHQFKKMP